MTTGIRVLVVDNHDSFVHTLIGYLAELGADVEMVESDAADVLSRMDDADGVLISPGPGTPEDAGASIEVVRRCARTATPLLGVCLGHQAIAAAFGGVVSHAPDLMHGRTSAVHHEGAGVFAGLPDPFTATRYHSLAVERSSVPAELRVTAWTASGTVMGLAHRSLPIEGVQFHPESVLTEGGYLLLGTWLEGIGVMDAAARGARLSPHRTVT
ncbi:gamma-glutamyl-gamma-aminobutyrate hydrolase family protein [Microbacterium oleivorans]|uniref:anthranilate synthase component II n=1 Tax=Microbacterium TaxID=33882 RepID=UPI0033DB6F80